MKTILPWAQPGWIEQASAWILAQLDQRHLALAGAIEQPHIRPWSTVLLAPTSQGAVYFKATTPVLAHEPALTQWLAARRPDCIAEVWAIDQERGWMLMPSGGPTLRSQVQSAPDIRHWEKLLPLYAQLQIEMVAQRETLLGLGALDYRLGMLPARYAALLADRDSLLIDQTDGLSSADYARLHAFLPGFQALCEQLATYGLPETLHHDDFHDGNVFVYAGGYRIFDWGESCVSQPFYTLVVGLRSVAYRFGLAEDAPELVRLRDSYLEPWSSFASRAELLAACALAQQIGMVCRALTWHRVVASLAAPLRQEHAEAVPGWLLEFLATIGPEAH